MVFVCGGSFCVEKEGGGGLSFVIWAESGLTESGLGCRGCSGGVSLMWHIGCHWADWASFRPDGFRRMNGS